MTRLGTRSTIAAHSPKSGCEISGTRVRGLPSIILALKVQGMWIYANRGYPLTLFSQTSNRVHWENQFQQLLNSPCDHIRNHSNGCSNIMSWPDILQLDSPSTQLQNRGLDHVDSAETGVHDVDCSPSRYSTSNIFSTACSKRTLSAVLSDEERLPADELVCRALALT